MEKQRWEDLERRQEVRRSEKRKSEKKQKKAGTRKGRKVAIHRVQRTATWKASRWKHHKCHAHIASWSSSSQGNQVAQGHDKNQHVQQHMGRAHGQHLQDPSSLWPHKTPDSGYTHGDGLTERNTFAAVRKLHGATGRGPPHLPRCREAWA